MVDANADPRKVNEHEFPVDAALQQKLEFLLNFAVLAPSSHNTQPWFFRIVDDAVELYADWSRRLDVVDPQGRELIMSCGAALLHLQLAMRHFGHDSLVEPVMGCDPPILLARVRLGEAYHESTEEQMVFESIAYRRTNRLPFSSEEVPGQLIIELEDLAAQYGTKLHVLWKSQQRRAVGQLIAEAEQTQFAEKPFRRELAEWIHNPHDARRDGLPPKSLGHPHAPDWTTPITSFAIRSLNAGAARATKDAHLAMDAPLLAVLATAGDTPADWLAAGQTIAHLLLLACSWGVSASFFNQPIEVADDRAKLKQIACCQGSPQFLLRLGYARNVEPTPRRSVSEVLLSPLPVPRERAG